MDYICCDPIEEKPSDSSEDSITCSTDAGILECDYDTHCTKLYKAIEDRKWEEVLYYLETGKWYSASVFNVFSRREESPSEQARTWVTAMDNDGQVRWCQLPLHAAITFLAPFSVVSKLVEVYPKSVRCADDQDMLPLHYAFRFGATDDVLLHVLEKFPQAISKKAVKDRVPLDLASFGTKPERGNIIDYYMQSAVRNAKLEWDNEYEKMVTGNGSKPTKSSEGNSSFQNEKLKAALTELNKTRMELQALKRDQQHSSRDDRSLHGSLSLKEQMHELKQQQKQINSQMQQLREQHKTNAGRSSNKDPTSTHVSKEPGAKQSPKMQNLPISSNHKRARRKGTNASMSSSSHHKKRAGLWGLLSRRGNSHSRGRMRKRRK